MEQLSDELNPALLPLSDAERQELAECEAVIERGLRSFIEVGTRLAQVRDGRLYRETHPTFEAWLQERWGLARSRGYQLMTSASVAVAMSKILDAPVPVIESHAAALAGLEPEVAAELYRVAEGRGKVTADGLREVRRQYERVPVAAGDSVAALLQLHQAGMIETPDLVTELAALGVDLSGLAIDPASPDRVATDASPGKVLTGLAGGEDSPPVRIRTPDQVIPEVSGEQDFSPDEARSVTQDRKAISGDKSVITSPAPDSLADVYDGLRADVQALLNKGTPASYVLFLLQDGMTERAERFAREHGVPAEVLTGFWRPILDQLRQLTVEEALAMHRAVADGTTEAAED